MVTFRASALYVAAVRGTGEPATELAPPKEGGAPTTTPITTPITTDGAAASNQARIVAALRVTPGLSGPDLAKLLGITADGVKYHIRRLKVGGLIRRHGPKGGHWEVLAEPPSKPTSTDTLTTQEALSTTQESSPTTRESGADAASIRSKLLVLLEHDAAMTRSALAQQLGITPDGVKYHLEQLKAQGRLRRTGSTKKGTWEVLP